MSTLYYIVHSQVRRTQRWSQWHMWPMAVAAAAQPTTAGPAKNARYLRKQTAADEDCLLACARAPEDCCARLVRCFATSISYVCNNALLKRKRGRPNVNVSGKQRKGRRTNKQVCLNEKTRALKFDERARINKRGTQSYKRAKNIQKEK